MLLHTNWNKLLFSKYFFRKYVITFWSTYSCNTTLITRTIVLRTLFSCYPFLYITRPQRYTHVLVSTYSCKHRKARSQHRTSSTYSTDSLPDILIINGDVRTWVMPYNEQKVELMMYCTLMTNVAKDIYTSMAFAMIITCDDDMLDQCAHILVV